MPCVQDVAGSKMSKDKEFARVQGNGCLRHSRLFPKIKIATLAGLLVLGGLKPALATELPRIKPDVPPLAVSVPAGPHAILGEVDAERYARIFGLQERGKMQAADVEIFELDNDVLMGHVLFQRYLHPTAYRSRFSELSDWLALYNDHPGASRIYHLAKRRRPASAANPKRHEPRRWRAMPNNQGLKANPPRRKSASQRRRVRQIKATCVPF